MLQVTLLEQTGIDPGDIVLAPAFAALPERETVCVYGNDEQDDSGCTEAALKGAQLIGLPGAHHFDDDVKTLFDSVSAAVRARAKP